MGCTNAVVEIENTAAIATCHRRCCCCCCLLLSIATQIDKFTLYTPLNENSTRDSSQMTKMTNEYVFIYRRNVYEHSTLTNLWRKKTILKMDLIRVCLMCNRIGFRHTFVSAMVGIDVVRRRNSHVFRLTMPNAPQSSL